MPTLMKGAAAQQAICLENERRMQALKQRGIQPCLAVLRVGDKSDDIAYEASIAKRCAQRGILFVGRVLPQEIGTEQLIDTVKALGQDASVHGIMVLRPLPRDIDENAVTEAITPEKDVDGATRANMAKVFAGDADAFAPCTAEAVVRLLQHEQVPLSGAEAVVIGRSTVVGRPLAMLLLHEHATVTVCHTRTRNLPEVCRRASVLIAAAGQREMVNDAYIAPGAVVVDVGIHVDEQGKLCGDVDRAILHADRVTPVPGGVGGVTTELLMEHVIRAAEVR